LLPVERGVLVKIAACSRDAKSVTAKIAACWKWCGTRTGCLLEVVWYSIKQAAYSKYVMVWQQNWLLVAKVRQLFLERLAATSNLGRLQALSEQMWL
jgi:hypothetical protein